MLLQADRSPGPGDARKLAGAGLTGREVTFDDDEIIVSKTDLKGRITYCNRVFLRVSGYREKQLLGAPHSLIRHPDMPRAVFKMMWDTLADGREIFAYVVNRCLNGDHYWVLAHVTPSRNGSGAVVGYHSNRRRPDARIVRDAIIPLYADLRRIEEAAPSRRDGMLAAEARMQGLLRERGVAYDAFVASLAA